MQMWLSTGTVENWETAISGNIWGVVEGLKHYWDKQLNNINIYKVWRSINA